MKHKDSFREGFIAGIKWVAKNDDISTQRWTFELERLEAGESLPESKEEIINRAAFATRLGDWLADSLNQPVGEVNTVVAMSGY